MAGVVEADVAEAMLRELVDLLHQGASPEEFAALLAQAGELPDDLPAKAGLAERIRMGMAVRNRLEVWQQRESGMLAVIESARDLSSRLNLDELLHAVVSRSRKLLGSQVAWLSTYDAALGAFHVVAADGALAQSTGHMVAGRGLGIVSVVVETRLPFTTPDYLHDKRFPHDEALDASFRDEGIAAVAGVPLLWEDEVIGLLFVADRYHRTHTAQSISILSTLATHAAVAVKNAMAFEQAKAALASAEAARAELERHARSVQRAAEAHEQMTSLLARGASLSDLCQAIAALMGGSVLVLDEAAQVISQGTAAEYAGCGAATYAPNGRHSAALAQAARQSRQLGRSVVAYQEAGETCRVNAVIGGNDVLGSVLFFAPGDLDAMAIRNLERSSTFIGIVLLSRERMEASHRRDLSALLRGLVSPRQDDLRLLCERAQGFGVDLTQPSQLVLVEWDDLEAGHAARRLRAGKLAAGAVFDDIDGVLTLLCPASRAAEVRRALAEAGGEGGCRGILSRPLAQATDLPAAYLALRRALPVLARMGVQGRLVTQAEMTLYATLFETQDQAGLAAFLDATIGALLTHDHKRNSELAATLLCYFDCNQNAKDAARRLDIHVNTVRQRLATIEGLLGDWNDAVRALEIHVALRLWSLRTALR
ncbi:helix-turn-helix domain-containing protein [Ramlibacter pallidus]|uniref:Helix-turn-helix domain-containing protein n=1 Tax=Ramlibacter pallidus TaxID=2780087 RepID=A0ABR9S0C1_9BURK|nr:helix-turn-helix domain-containing protein [Ramlibacter pallidus]MBE7366529.1 helix-turn-helix domain-containing protein [Ramlibacter pallidus]